MPRNPEDDWRLERLDALRKEIFTETGPRRAIKVVKPGTILTEARGYIMLGISIVGSTPMEIANDAGLRKDDFVLGARVYKLARVPQISEIEYDLTAESPAGLAYVEGMSNPDFPPGAKWLQQWKIREGCSIRILPGYLDLGPGDRLPYNWLLIRVASSRLTMLGSSL
jgi:hypothetical protein